MAEWTEEAQVVIVGGGAMGAGLLYHLCHEGWTDVVLIEKGELSSGSTWHAAGLIPHFIGSLNMAKCHQIAPELYQRLEEETGEYAGWHATGAIRLALDEHQEDWFRYVQGMLELNGVESHLIPPEQILDFWPCMDVSDVRLGFHTPHDGWNDPSMATAAMVKAARALGARVHRHTLMTDMRRLPDGRWELTTDKGTITCEHFVNAGGLWAREVGRMAGLEIPVLAMEHMYLLTEEVPQLAEWRESSKMVGFHVVDLGGEIYMREEGNSLLLGTYEKGGVPWSTRTTPWDFEAQLLTPDLERIAESLDVGFSHFPIFNEIGIRQTINGPFTFAPDGNPLIGPVRSQPGHWLACGVMAGLSQGGGVGLAMANWITNGDPGFDVWGMDHARFGDWATPVYTNAKVRENYGRRFTITFPNEELPAARPHLTSPLYERLRDRNAVFGASYGLEQALWFQRPGIEPFETPTFRRSNAFEVVAEEVAAVRSGVGLMEITGYAKYEFSGAGAREFLDGRLSNFP